MKHTSIELSKRTVASIAGWCILLMSLLAGFAYSTAFSSLIVPNNPTLTTANIMLSQTLFRSGIFCFLIVLILDVVVGWALYVFLREVNKNIALLTALVRVVYACMLGIALFALVIVLQLTNSTHYVQAFATQELKTLVMLCVDAFGGMWSLSLVVFGAHLLLLGYLIIKSDYVPKIIGLLLLIAGGGYIITNVAYLLLPAYVAYKGMLEVVFIVPMILGEVVLGLWLLLRGGKNVVQHGIFTI